MSRGEKTSGRFRIWFSKFSMDRFWIYRFRDFTEKESRNNPKNKKLDKLFIFVDLKLKSNLFLVRFPTFISSILIFGFINKALAICTSMFPLII